MKIVFSNMAFDVPEKLESAPTSAASSPSLSSVADAQPAYSQQEPATSPVLTSYKRECTRRFPKGHKELDPAFAPASMSACDIGQFT